MGETNTEPREIPIKFDGAAESKEGLADAGAEPVKDLEAADTCEDSKSSDAEVASDRMEPDPNGNTGQVEAIEPTDLQTQVDALMQERSALYDQLLRRRAEFENYRKRIDRERAETYQRARAEVLVELLPVVDNLERALSSLETSQGDAEALRHGVELIHKQFRDALSKFGLEPVASLGEAFDPNVHEAVTTEPSDQHEENTIIEEFQRGYKMGNKLLRPAKVKVASTPER
jgi:molecular chaperone GrpE